MTWLDAILVILVMSVAALAAERRWTGAIMSAAGLLALGPLLRLGQGSPLVALLIAVAGGLVLAIVLTRLIPASNPATDRSGMLAGSVMGVIFAAALLLSVLVSLPIGRTAANEIVYPAQSLPLPVQQAAVGSPLFQYSRSVLLQPLLAPAGDSASQLGITRWLHDWLVPGEPWLDQQASDGPA